MRRLALTTVTVAAVGCLVACGSSGGGGDGGGGNSGSVQAVDGPVDRGSLNEVCDGKVALNSAAPFAGPAPHPVTVFSQQQGNDPSGPRFPIRLVSELNQEEHSAFQSPMERTQLVACAERVADTPTEVVCRFDLGAQDRVPFFRTAYRITVREARTGKVVATVPVDPAAEGCPTSVRVTWAGAKVFSAPADRQLVSALQAFTSWAGTGTPPAAAGPADIPAPAGAPAVEGSVHMTTAAGVDPASPVLRDHLAFWAAFSALQEGDRADFTALRDRVGGTLLDSLTSIIGHIRDTPGRSVRGPVHLMVTGVSQENGTVAVDSCVDETERETMQQSAPTGEAGFRYRIRVSLTPTAGRYVATDWADPPPAGCPPPAGRIG
ncbi:hypothetical protein CC117_00150 [Parafrankia colletiae]|uniref:Lipoprotein n=1 Tax=Parafrankia colletiae TaxID=573497 RepID=A0A1S1RJB7_9ACTN|nr:hypothetical protein [Parafrankia colletiae]MCK9902791.1 hypothetical protein [Frankia sp. Cpl3]OHV46127.1 hypothetical protein CC117_00150 [Parafrankia colletiae]